VTDTVDESEQPALLNPTTVYVVATEGDAITDAPVATDSPNGGDQAYVLPPVALNVEEAPGHNDTPEPALITGNGSTVTAIVAVPLQPRLLVPARV
jgi:hypothetical protein